MKVFDVLKDVVKGVVISNPLTPHNFAHTLVHLSMGSEAAAILRLAWLRIPKNFHDVCMISTLWKSTSYV